MTSKNKPHPSRDPLLERILSRVQSIDRNVEEILEKVGDHFDDVRLDQGTREYHGPSGYDDDSHYDA